MAETNLTGIAISVEMLEKRFAKKKIAAKLEKALKSQKAFEGSEGIRAGKWTESRSTY